MKKIPMMTRDDALKGVLSFTDKMNANAAVDAPKAVTVDGTFEYKPIFTAGRKSVFGDTVTNFTSYLGAAKDGAAVSYASPIKQNAVEAPEVSGTEQDGTEQTGTAPVTVNWADVVSAGNRTEDGTPRSFGYDVAGAETPQGLSFETVKRAADSRSALEPRKKTFEEWMTTDGVDTETEFQNARAQLEYEMQTWRANYGANAERLAQMGLSNAGVVDIYGTGVIQAYASAMNDLYLAKIEQDRLNLDAYKKYSDQYEADLAARTQTFNNNVTAAYAYGLELYDGNNIDAVTTMIQNAGYDADVVAQAVARLSAVDPSMLPALKEQAAAEQTKVLEAFNSLAANYKSEQADGLRKIYGPEGMGWSEDAVNSLISMLDGYAATMKAGDTGDQELTAGVKAVKDLFYDDKGNYAYTGSDAQKESIRQQLRGTAYETMTDQIISQMDADLAAIKGAAADDTVSEINQLDNKNLTVSGMTSDLDQAAAEYGVDSEEYKKIQKSYSDKISGAISGVFDHGADIDSYGSLVGASAEEWAAMDDSAKVETMYNALGELHKEGYMTDEAYYSLTDKLVKNEISGVLGSVTKTSFRELSDVLLMCKNYLDAGYIDQAKYNEYRDELIGPIDDLESKGAAGQYGEYPHAEFVVDFGGKEFKLDVFANETPVRADEYEKMNEHRGVNEVFDYNGKLYVWIPGGKGEIRGAEWERADMIYPLKMNVAATGQGKGDEAQLNAMYELLWYYITSYDR